MAKPSVMIDCDPGKDDALALWLAVASPELDLRMVTTVGGNVGVSRTTANALTVLAVAGRSDVPVHAGCPVPLVRVQRTAEEVHGASGIDGADLPPAKASAASNRGAVALVESIMAIERPVTVAALAPLTNLAVAFAIEPRLAERIERLVVMGGGFAMGNVTEFAEFNIFVDPHAAAVVFRSGAPITLVPLDVTRRVLANPAWLDRLERTGRVIPRAAAGMYRASPDLALHDPCVITWLVRPDLFGGRPAHVAVATEEGPEVGRTIMVPDKAPNAHVLLEVDGAGVLDFVAQRLATL